MVLTSQPWKMCIRDSKYTVCVCVCVTTTLLNIINTVIQHIADSHVMNLKQTTQEKLYKVQKNIKITLQIYSNVHNIQNTHL